MYAESSYEKAVSQMKRADDLATMRHVETKELISASREVVQTADDSREIAMKRVDEGRINADKATEAQKLADARAGSAEETRARMTAEATNCRCESRAVQRLIRPQQNSRHRPPWRNRTVTAPLPSMRIAAGGRRSGPTKCGSTVGPGQSGSRSFGSADAASRAGSRSAASQVAATIQRDFRHARHCPRPDRQLVGCLV